MLAVSLVVKLIGELFLELWVGALGKHLQHLDIFMTTDTIRKLKQTIDISLQLDLKP